MRGRPVPSNDRGERGDRSGWEGRSGGGFRDRGFCAGTSASLPPPPPNTQQQQSSALPQPRQLTSLINNADRARDLLMLYSKYSQHFNGINIAACWSRIARYVPREREAVLNSGDACIVPLRKQTVDALHSTWACREVSGLTLFLSRFKLSGPAWDGLWRELGIAVCRMASQLDEKTLANIVWTWATASPQANADVFDAIAEQAVDRVGVFSPQSLANAAWAFAKADRPAPRLFDAIASAAQQRLGDFKAQDLANVCWAYSTAGHVAPDLLSRIAAMVPSRIDEFSAQGLCNTLWAIATAGHPAPDLFGCVAARGLSRGWGPHELSGIPWAFARAGHAAPELFDAVAEAAVPRLREYGPQDFATTAMAYATAGHAAPELMDAMATAMAERLDEFTPPALATLASAYATLGHAAPLMFDEIATVAIRRLGELKPQDLASLAWAFATEGHEAPLLLDAVAKAALERLGGLTTQELAKMAAAFATARHEVPGLFDALASEAMPRVGQFMPQSLVKLAWAFSSAGHAAPELLDAIGLELVPRLPDLDPWELCRAAWAFAQAGRAAEGMLDAVAARASLCLDDLHQADMGNLAWSFAVLDHLPQDSTLFGQRFAQRCEELYGSMEAGEAGGDDCSQLHQWRLWYNGERGLSEALPGDALLQQCHEAFACQPSRPAAHQPQLGAALHEAGFAACEAEVRHESGYLIDFVIEAGGERIAVEADGPSRFIGRAPTGATLLKRRQLRRLGTAVAPVPYFEWEGMEDGAERAAYLRDAIGKETSAKRGSNSDGAFEPMRTGSTEI